MKLRAVIVVEYDPEISDYESKEVIGIESAIQSDKEWIADGFENFIIWLAEYPINHKISVTIDERKE